MNKCNRVIWIDNVKIIAMILIVLCHFSQSMIESGITKRTDFVVFFNEFSYLFHVQLFFLCSGWLYQKYSNVTNISSYKNNVIKKFIALGIPFFFFTAITNVFKTFFSSFINNEAGSLIKEFFITPVPPYWFLYVLFLIFLITPTVKTKKQAAGLIIVSLVLFITINVLNSRFNIIYPASKTLTNWIWFCLGIFICKTDMRKIFSPYSSILLVVATIIAIIKFNLNISDFILDGIITLLSCFGIIGFIGWAYKNNNQSPVFKYISKYTMPIFLMHTIFAAGIRSVLFKIGITNSVIHIIIGLVATFAGPVIAAIIMERIHLDFFIYPLNYIKLNKSKKKRHEDINCK